MTSRIDHLAPPGGDHLAPLGGDHLAPLGGAHRIPRTRGSDSGPVLAVVTAALLSGALLAGAGGVVAQETREPAPPDTAPVVLPDHEERELANGLRLIVVPVPDAEATTYTLLVPGGSAADAPGREGTAAILASLMQSAGEEEPGMELGVTASADAMALTLVDSTSAPSAAARRLGDVLQGVPITDSAVAAARSARRELVAGAVQRVDVVANRALLRAVYGDHPYGRPEVPSTLDDVTAADVEAWRDAHLRPDGSVLAVTGPVRADDVAPVLESAIRGWEADEGAPLEPAESPLPPGIEARRILVHRPGMERAVIHVGVPLPPAGHPDWTALAVLDGVLSGRRDAPLVTVTPPGADEGLMAGTATAAQRRRGPGIFHARAGVQTGVAADVVRGLLAGIAGAGEEFLPPRVLRPVQDQLASSFRTQASIPEGAAALMAVNRVLDLPDSLMASYPARVRRLGPQDLREVAARHLDTARVSVVVMGDATLLRGDLEALGPFEVVDVAGEPLTPEEIEVVEELPPLDASALDPVTLEYGVIVQEERVGTITRTLEAGPDSFPGTMRLRSRAELGGQEVSQSVVFTVPGFQPVAASSTVRSGEQSGGMSVTVADGRVTGTVRSGPGESRNIDSPMPEGALFGDMLEVAAWLAAFHDGGPAEGPGTAYMIQVVAPEAGTVSPLLLRVGPVEEVEVPAGTFRARRVELGGARPQTVWVSVEDPRVPVRVMPAGRPVRMDLLSVQRTPGG